MKKENFLLKPRSSWTLFLLTLVLTALWLWFMIVPHTWTFFMGYSAVEGDVDQHLSGWYAYFHEPWHFPLLHIDLINYPEGTSVFLTDSLPLFALFFKLIRSFLPPEFNYLGLFIIFCFILQGLGTFFLLLSLNQRSLLLLLFGVFFALSAPIMDTRIVAGDSAVCQGFILFALAAYFALIHQKLATSKVHFYFGIIIILSLFIHAYLFAMVFALYLACLFELHFYRLAQKSFLFKGFLTLCLVIVAIFVVFGFIAGSKRVGGFGIYSMNLIAPFWGGYFTHYQTIFPVVTQFEGFAYLGLGLIFLFLLTIVLNFKKLGGLIKRHRALFVMALLLSLYATSLIIYLGPYRILNLPFGINGITNTFRANGRFFWPVWYLIMVFSIVSLFQFNQRLFLWVAPIAFAVQLFDTSGYARAAQQRLSAAIHPSQSLITLNQQVSALMRQSQMIVFYPKTDCPGTQEINFLVETQLRSAQLGIPINTGSIGHYYTTHCTDDAAKFSKMGTLLLVSPSDDPSPTIKKRIEADPKSCHTLATGIYCIMKG